SCSACRQGKYAARHGGQLYDCLLCLALVEPSGPHARTSRCMAPLVRSLSCRTPWSEPTRHRSESDGVLKVGLSFGSFISSDNPISDQRAPDIGCSEASA